MACQDRQTGARAPAQVTHAATGTLPQAEAPLHAPTPPLSDKDLSPCNSWR